jgi:hypothetical protein
MIIQERRGALGQDRTVRVEKCSKNIVGCGKISNWFGREKLQEFQTVVLSQEERRLEAKVASKVVGIMGVGGIEKRTLVK